MFNQQLDAKKDLKRHNNKLLCQYNEPVFPKQNNDIVSNMSKIKPYWTLIVLFHQVCYSTIMIHKLKKLINQKKKTISKNRYFSIFKSLYSNKLFFFWVCGNRQNRLKNLHTGRNCKNLIRIVIIWIQRGKDNIK